MTPEEVAYQVAACRDAVADDPPGYPGERALVALADLVERYGAALREVEAQRRRNGAADNAALTALESIERDVFRAVRR